MGLLCFLNLNQPTVLPSSLSAAVSHCLLTPSASSPRAQPRLSTPSEHKMLCLLFTEKRGPTRIRREQLLPCLLFRICALPDLALTLQLCTSNVRFLRNESSTLLDKPQDPPKASRKEHRSERQHALSTHWERGKEVEQGGLLQHSPSRL